MAKSVVVAMAGNEMEATLWVDALRDEGIRATHYPVGVTGALGGVTAGSFGRHAVLVDRTQVAEARSVVASMGGAEALEPVDEESRGGMPTWLLVAGGTVLVLGAIVMLAV